MIKKKYLYNHNFEHFRVQEDITNGTECEIDLLIDFLIKSKENGANGVSFDYVYDEYIDVEPFKKELENDKQLEERLLKELEEKRDFDKKIHDIEMETYERLKAKFENINA